MLASDMLDRACRSGATRHRNLRARGVAALRRGDPALAALLLNVSLIVSRADGDTYGEAASLAWMAAVEGRYDPKSAREHALQAVALVRRERMVDLAAFAFALASIFDRSAGAARTSDPEINVLALAASIHPNMCQSERLERWTALNDAMAKLPASAAWTTPLLRLALKRAGME